MINTQRDNLTTDIVNLFPFLFQKDDVIVLVKELDSDWLVGQIGDKEGMFPKSFVKVKMPLQGQVSRSLLFVLFIFELYALGFPLYVILLLAYD